ncbi:hypothetical protein [Escherichia coli]|uniref:hypothetical protein n=1 Tax=Escherichia coli TaxID=562 RepID=UPI000BE9C46B|nr:hypothetical protein [Escherichia coli]
MESMAEGMIKDLVASGHALADDMTGAPSVLVRCLAAQLEVQLVRANALAAENAAFKDINQWCKTDAFSNMYREFKTAEAVGCCNIDCMHDAMVVAIMHAPEAPATDAFLTEIERKAIRKFINSIEHILRDKLSPYDTEEMLEAMRIFLEEQGGEQK